MMLPSCIDPGTGIPTGFSGCIDDTSYLFGANSWGFNYNDIIAGGNHAAAIASGENRLVTMPLVPEPGNFLLCGLGASPPRRCGN